ncbi:MAG: hypothetical protein ACLRZ6_06665 [Lachnospiraceae bacterium]
MKWINDSICILAAHVWGSCAICWLRAVKRLRTKDIRGYYFIAERRNCGISLPLGLGAVLIINEILVLDGRFIQCKLFQ